MSFLRRTLDPFRRAGRIDVLLAAIVVAMHGVLLFNALLHHPLVGYDAWGYLTYAQALSEGRFPTPAESHEFFSPPLPFAPVAATAAVARSAGLDGLGAVMLGGKVLQLINVLCSLVLVQQLLRLCEFLRPGDFVLKRTAVLLLASLPVYYKSFAMVRAEPMLAMLCLLAVRQVIEIWERRVWSLRRALLLGTTLGLAALTRQWGLMLIPALLVAALGAAALDREGRRVIWRTTVVAALACILVGSWFYAHLHLRHGSVMAFNKSAPTESRLPRARFFTDLARDQLFTSPVRPALDGRLWPSLLSEFWGDHAAYFVVRGWDLRRGRLACGEAFEPPPVGLPRDQLRSNREEIAPYLGRVNVVSLAPTLVLLLGTLVTASSLGLSRGHLAPRGFALALALAFIASTLLFYGWYLWRFVAPEPAAIVKATYLLQVVPFVALLAADALVALRARSAVVFTAVITLWCLALAHNLPVLFSRYLRWPS